MKPLTTYHVPTDHLLLTTYHLSLTTYDWLLATGYWLLTTYYLLLTTYYVLLTTYYLLLTTYYLLLTTYYLPPPLEWHRGLFLQGIECLARASEVAAQFNTSAASLHLPQIDFVQSQVLDP